MRKKKSKKPESSAEEVTPEKNASAANETQSPDNKETEGSAEKAAPEKKGSAAENQSSDIKKSRATLTIALIAVFVLVGILATTIILLMQTYEQTIAIDLSDWLKIIIPLVGSGLVAIFAFLGVDRLKHFDDRQDKLAKELRAEVGTEIEREFKSRLPDFKDDLKKLEDRREKLNQEWETHCATQFKEWDFKIAEYNAKIKEYEHISDSIDKADMLGNLEEAHNFLSDLMFGSSSSGNISGSQRIQIMERIVERVKNGDIQGDFSDYHNLASEFARQGYYELACKVASEGRTVFPFELDLRSDFLYYASKMGRTNEVDKGIQELDQIPRNFWNWRAFTFYIDTLNAREATDENKEKTLECVEDYHKILPAEERAYMAEYETYMKYGDRDDAVGALEIAERKLLMTAQCSLRLSEIYHMRGAYDKAIASATRAIIGQAETQPSSNTGAAFAQRGFSRDAQIQKAILDGVPADMQYEAIQDAIRDYKMAIHFGYGYKNIQTRIVILRNLLPKDMQAQINAEDLQERLQQLERETQKIAATLNALLKALQDGPEDNG